MILITAIYWILQIYSFILLGRVLLSWFPNVDRSNPIVKFLHQATEPVLQPVREALPPMSGMDFSPLVVFLGIMVLQRMLIMAF